jgi:hypothetical protein
MVYFKFFFSFKFPAIIFRVFILGGNYLPLYRVYLARVGYKG